MGFFQEAEQVAAMAPYAKYAKRVEKAERLPIYIAEAVKKSLMGVPGPSYLDLPGDIITAEVEESDVQWAERVPDPPRLMSDPNDVRAAIEAIKTAEQPLVIFGKGIAASRAESEMRQFVEKTGIPYLAMPMAKGIIPDDHELASAAARSFVLSNTDLIFLAGARLNWMLHFGLPPRFRPDVRVVQLDFNPEEISVNVDTEVALIGDAKQTLGQMLDVLEQDPWEFPQDSEWLQSVRAEARQNAEAIQSMYDDHSTPLQYYPALKSIDDALERDAIIVAEGASTMDISRTVLNNYEARTRLDAGSFGSMGLGHGFAVAAQVEYPDRRVLCLQGDGAFGFAGTECEVAVRYNLPITWVVFNNGGIGGHTQEQIDSGTVPPGAMSPGARYDLMMEGLGGKGYQAETIDELNAALADAFKLGGPSLINVPIAPDAKRKPQKFGWLTSTT
jgi:2-hydroxyacyl-CoA lyase 1